MGPGASPNGKPVAVISCRCFHYVNANMSDTDLDKEMVYVAYRDIFKGKLAQLRKRAKVRNVVEKHKNHLHHKQLADSMDSEKTYKILRCLLADRLFESDSAAQAAFPALFSPGNGTALIVKCMEDGFEADNGQRDGERPDALHFPVTLHSPDAPMSNGASPESTPMVRQYRVDRRGRIRKPTRATTEPTGLILQAGNGKEAESKQVIRGGINTSLLTILLGTITLTTIFLYR